MFCINSRIARPAAAGRAIAWLLSFVVLSGSAFGAKVVLFETFDDDVPDTLPNTVDNYARSSTAPDPLLDPATAVVTGGMFPDPFGIPGNQSLVLHNPDSTTQMAVTWFDEFEDDPSTFRNGTIEFDLYIESPDPMAYWTYLGVRIGHGDETRRSVSTTSGSDVTIWNSFRATRLAPENESLVEQLSDEGGRFLVGAPTTYADPPDSDDDLYGPDRPIRVKYVIDGTGTSFEDPPKYTLLVSDSPVTWNDGESEHFWIINTGSFEFAPGINIISFLTDASARSKLNEGYAAGIGNVYIDNLRIVNDDLEDVPMSADLDLDGDVDGNDFLLIQQSDPSLIAAWKDQFGLGAAGGAAAVVPEPAAGALALLAAATLARKRQVLRR